MRKLNSIFAKRNSKKGTLDGGAPDLFCVISRLSLNDFL